MAVPYYSEGNSDRNPPSQHPISPPPELVQRWTHFATENELVDEEIFAAHAAQWGADQELEACIRHLDLGGHHPTVLDDLRAARRPKPPSLKAQALDELNTWAEVRNSGPGESLLCDGLSVAIIRKALEALPDD